MLTFLLWSSCRKLLSLFSLPAVSFVLIQGLLVDASFAPILKNHARALKNSVKVCQTYLTKPQNPCGLVLQCRVQWHVTHCLSRASKYKCQQLAGFCLLVNSKTLQLQLSKSKSIKGDRCYQACVALLEFNAEIDSQTDTGLMSEADSASL